MKKFLSLLVLSGTFSVLSASLPTFAQTGFDAGELAELDSLLQGYVDRGELAGNVTLVMHGGQVAYLAAKGMQNIETSRSMQPDSIFRISSQTSAVTSAAIMMLQEDGLLSIDDLLSDYLPEWETVRVAVPGDVSYRLAPVNRPIRLRDLLTHSSGIGYGTDTMARNFWSGAGVSGWYLADQNRPIRELVRLMARLPQDAHPGTEWRFGYSSDILGAVVEEVSGQNLDDFFRERIFTPLGMDDTHFYLPQAKTDRLTVVYSSQPNGSISRAPEVGEFAQGAYIEGPRVLYSGGAGLLSTAEDYASFLAMIANGGSYNGVRLLQENSVAMMTQDQLNGIPFRQGVGFGLGFSVITNAAAVGQPGSTGSYGWSGTYHSTYWVDPAYDLIVVYLSQLLPADDIDDFSTLRSSVYEALAD